METENRVGLVHMSDTFQFFFQGGVMSTKRLKFTAFLFICACLVLSTARARVFAQTFDLQALKQEAAK